jgi:hypothetical protein
MSTRKSFIHGPLQADTERRGAGRADEGQEHGHQARQPARLPSEEGLASSPAARAAVLGRVEVGGADCTNRGDVIHCLGGPQQPSELQRAHELVAAALHLVVPRGLRPVTCRTDDIRAPIERERDGILPTAADAGVRGALLAGEPTTRVCALPRPRSAFAARCRSVTVALDATHERAERNQDGARGVPRLLRDANAADVIVAETAQGRAIPGVVDGSSPRGVENDEDVMERKGLLRRFGYKL